MITNEFLFLRLGPQFSIPKSLAVLGSAKRDNGIESPKMCLADCSAGEI